MSLSRRQFFRFWGGGHQSAEKRQARFEDLETYVRTHLLPYDFTLTNAQELDLIAHVRAMLERTPDEILFSTDICVQIQELVQIKIEPWRLNSNVAGREDHVREIRLVAPDYVADFVRDPASAPTIEQMKHTYGIDDLAELEGVLREQMQGWINQTDDRLLAQCDIVTVKDLVFAQLRSWC